MAHVVELPNAGITGIKDLAANYKEIVIK